MRVGALWRYPVKSMAGESLTRATATSAGLSGDRVVQVCDRDGRVVTARRYPGLLRLRATLAADGEPMVNGVHWAEPQVSRWVEAAVAPGARLQRGDTLERFDILPLLVCTDETLSMFGRDARRLRPNIIVTGASGNAEREWQGATLKLPGAEIGLADLRARCVMTTYDPDSGTQDPNVFRDIVRRFDGRLCLNADVIRSGIITIGDAVTLHR